MRQYLLSIYQPDGDPPPSVDLEQIGRDVAGTAIPRLPSRRRSR